MALDNFIHTNMFHEHDHLLGRDYVSPALFELMNQTCELESYDLRNRTDPFAHLLPNFHLNASSSHTFWSEFEPMGTINSPTIAGDLHHQNSILSFGNGCNYYPSLISSSSSMLSFDHLEKCSSWLPAAILDPNPDINSSAAANRNSLELLKEDLILEEQVRWMNSGGKSSMEDKLHVQENDGLLGATLKRPYMVIDEVQVSKKHCTGINKNSKQTVYQDPQSIAAKNRRERISERLKVLQELVPNGTKVDLVSMLEKATSYVKFLQLQIKVLANDEFWQENGVKMLEVGEMKVAIDAILSSHNEPKATSNVSTALLRKRSKQ